MIATQRDLNGPPREPATFCFIYYHTIFCLSSHHHVCYGVITRLNSVFVLSHLVMSMHFMNLYISLRLWPIYITCLTLIYLTMLVISGPT
jgi:hypothetical protein